jgi:uncharacterized protein (TIGR02271 family)
MRRHEQQLAVDTRVREVGSVRARKRVSTEHVSHDATRDVEHAETERVEAGERDSGQIRTLEDGSVSIPIFEERLVVSKELFVRERIVIKRRVETETERIEADLRVEHIEVEGDVQEPATERANTTQHDGRNERHGS